jgi:hypothetical protein
MVFLLEALALAGAGSLHLVTDHSSPLGPAWLIGALVAAVAWRVCTDHGAVRGALVAQLLPALWMPFFVSVYPVGRCATGFFTTVSTLEAPFAGNGVLLLGAVARWSVSRGTASLPPVV